jgi:low affinity Fe/Cu permease
MKKYLYSLIFILIPTVVFAHGMSVADQQRILQAGFPEFCWLGAKHMITGYDHLLFLFGVIFFLTKFKDIVKFVTAFTIGHSITLIFATFLGIKANYFLVDAIIALTVMYKGFDNIDGFKKYLNIKSPSLLKAVFIFGLIHGFGLSTRLQQLPLGEKGGRFLWKIVSFNIGVELGQIAALVIMLFLLSAWRKTESFKKFSVASNVGLIIVGALLLLLQLHGYIHTKAAEEFPLNKDYHYHLHQAMDEKIEEPMVQMGRNREIKLTEAGVIPRASEHVATFIEQGTELRGIGKLDEKWKNVPQSQIKYEKWNSSYYVVSFTLPKEKETLFLLLSFAGTLYDVNFTGDFEQWKINP